MKWLMIAAAVGITSFAATALVITNEYRFTKVYTECMSPTSNDSINLFTGIEPVCKVLAQSYMNNYGSISASDEVYEQKLARSKERTKNIQNMVIEIAKWK